MNQISMDNHELINLLNSYSEKLTLSATQQGMLLDYVLLMLKWSRAYNLTSIRKPREIMIRHIFDSFSIAPYIRGKRVIDVGSGAGLPGVPLAVLFPEKEFVLIDSNGKKARFLLHVKQTLRLRNIYVVQERVESYRPPQCFNSITSRAFSSLQEMLQKTQHLCCPDGYFLAMKGAYPMTELEEITSDFMVDNVEVVQVPHLDETRHIVSIRFNRPNHE